MVGFGGLVALVVVAIASPVVDEPVLVLDPREAVPGQQVAVTGHGFRGCLPGDPTGVTVPPSASTDSDPDPVGRRPIPVTIRWEEDGRLLAEVVLDGEGTFATRFTVPADAAAERYLVTASCRRSPVYDEVRERADLTVVAPPGPITDPPPTSPVVEPTPARPASPAPPGGGGSAAPEAPSAGSDVLSAAFGSALLLGLGLFGVTRVVRSRSRRRSRPPVVSAVAAPAPPGSLDVRPGGPERAVALRVTLHADPGVLTVHRPEE